MNTGLSTLKDTGTDVRSQDNLLSTLAILLHHDAISGTHTEEVGHDYREMMTHAREDMLANGLSSEVARQAGLYGFEDMREV